MNTFNVEECYKQIIQWTRDWFNDNGPNMNVVIGMSGGKDSTITAKLLVDALGPNRVIGVGMPDDGQGENEAREICQYLGIKYLLWPIGLITSSIKDTAVSTKGFDHLTTQALQNIPPRVRMVSLYAIAQSCNAFVVNTCNLCEDFIGYATKGGDGAGDFSLLADLTVDEILELGDYCKIPREWVHKTPDDGLPFSQPDEQKLGFTYHALSEYIRHATKPDEPILSKIRNMHIKNLHKILPMPKFMYKG